MTCPEATPGLGPSCAAQLKPKSLKEGQASIHIASKLTMSRQISHSTDMLGGCRPKPMPSSPKHATSCSKPITACSGRAMRVMGVIASKKAAQSKCHGNECILEYPELSHHLVVLLAHRLRDTNNPLTASISPVLDQHL